MQVPLVLILLMVYYYIWFNIQIFYQYLKLHRFKSNQMKNKTKNKQTNKQTNETNKQTEKQKQKQKQNKTNKQKQESTLKHTKLFLYILVPCFYPYMYLFKKEKNHSDSYRLYSNVIPFYFYISKDLYPYVCYLCIAMGFLSSFCLMPIFSKILEYKTKFDLKKS